MKRHFSLIALLLLFLLPAAALGAAVDAVTRTVEKTVAVQQETQKEVSAWELERQQLDNDLQNLKMQADLLRHRQQKLQAYIRERQTRIDELQQSIAEQQNVARELEPFLDATLEQAKSLYQKDLPFLVDEREQRFADLALFLDSYDATPADKLRRVLEMLHIEARYGHHVEAGEGMLPLAGVETTVNIFRLGRIGLYYLSLDGTQAGWYNPSVNQWEPLPGRHLEAVKEALRMAMKQRAIDLVKLPLGKGGWQ
ncbi:MAG: DUF3450 domain-containing protein [Deltaproteobacteria bacterium]|nr:DUF3450 domain-containing protein [Candidatus Anaeroferrophillus wilburensis]MBN2889835.1 DUF3450 domain-containing protein [Deltaproteobacteria bacterium]